MALSLLFIIPVYPVRDKKTSLSKIIDKISKSLTGFSTNPQKAKEKSGRYNSSHL